MAPEQRDTPGDVDNRADIYSLGVVFYELLTGELPTGSFAPPSAKSAADPRVDAIVQQALEKERTRRQNSAGEMKTQVERVTEDPGSARASRVVAGGSPVDRPPLVPCAAASAPAGNLQNPPGEAANLGAAASPGDESSARAQTMTRGARALPGLPPRFSRNAIFGAVWAAFAFIAFWLTFEGVDIQRATAAEMSGSPTLLGVLLMVTLLPFGFTAPFGTTILGWIAVTQIRRAPGRLYGLGLAVFDGLFFPLLALDAMIGRLCVSIVGMLIAHHTQATLASEQAWDPNFANHITNRLQDSTVTIAMLAAALTAAIVDFLIVRSVWRAVTKSPEPVSNSSTEPHSHASRRFAGAETGHESRTAAGPSSAEDEAREQARQLVQAPAIGLLITGVLNCLVVAMIVLGFGLRFNSWGPIVFPAAAALIFAGLLAVLAFGCAVIVAALKMMQLKAYRFAVAASILAVLLHRAASSAWQSEFGR